MQAPSFTSTAHSLLGTLNPWQASRQANERSGTPDQSVVRLTVPTPSDVATLGLRAVSSLVPGAKTLLGLGTLLGMARGAGAESFSITDLLQLGSGVDTTTNTTRPLNAKYLLTGQHEIGTYYPGTGNATHPFTGSIDGNCTAVVTGEAPAPCLIRAGKEASIKGLTYQGKGQLMCNAHTKKEVVIDNSMCATKSEGPVTQATTTTKPPQAATTAKAAQAATTAKPAQDATSAKPAQEATSEKPPQDATSAKPPQTTNTASNAPDVDASTDAKIPWLPVGLGVLATLGFGYYVYTVYKAREAGDGWSEAAKGPWAHGNSQQQQQHQQVRTSDVEMT